MFGFKTKEQYYVGDSPNQPKLEMGIDIPVLRRGAPRLYPFLKMKPGDSFFLSAKNEPFTHLTWSARYGWRGHRCIRLMNSVRNCANAAGVKIEVRRMLDDSGIRVWFVGQKG